MNYLCVVSLNRFFCNDSTISLTHISTTNPHKVDPWYGFVNHFGILAGMNKSTFGLIAGTLVILGATRLLFFTGNESADSGPKQSSSSEVSADAFAELTNREEVTIIDVRTAEEIAEGKVVPDALELDYYDPNFATTLSELDRDTTYGVYCRSGRRSGETIALMKGLGFTSVVDLAGGEIAWRESGRILVKSNDTDEEPSDTDCTLAAC
jgi:phage shock protein E